MTTQSQPSTKLWDYAAYAAIPQDNLRHEIIAGQHFVNPAPNLYHQQVSRRIQFQLYSAIELNDLGVVFNAPVDLQLSKHDIVQPDLVIVLHERRHILTPAKIKGVPIWWLKSCRLPMNATIERSSENFTSVVEFPSIGSLLPMITRSLN